MKPLLCVRNLATHFQTDAGVVRAVDEVSFEVAPGGALGLVGESGCGKSVTALSIMGLVPSPPGKIVAGEILFDGEDLRKKSARDMSRLRGREIAMVFQEPMSALTPVYTVGYHLVEAIRRHRRVARGRARNEAMEILRWVGFSDPRRRMDEYPHQLSGGMRQRVLIAMALAHRPKLLIADEPTTALDVTIQAQVLELLRRFRREFGTALLLITHDLGVVGEMVDHVAVMSQGRIVEQGEVEALFAAPRHPYTAGLLDAARALDIESAPANDRDGVPLAGRRVPS